MPPLHGPVSLFSFMAVGMGKKSVLVGGRANLREAVVMKVTPLNVTEPRLVHVNDDFGESTRLVSRKYAALVSWYFLLVNTYCLMRFVVLICFRWYCLVVDDEEEEVEQPPSGNGGAHPPSPHRLDKGKAVVMGEDVQPCR